LGELLGVDGIEKVNRDLNAPIEDDKEALWLDDAIKRTIPAKDETSNGRLVETDVLGKLLEDLIVKELDEGHGSDEIGELMDLWYGLCDLIPVPLAFVCRLLPVLDLRKKMGESLSDRNLSCATESPVIGEGGACASCASSFAASQTRRLSPRRRRSWAVSVVLMSMALFGLRDCSSIICLLRIAILKSLRRMTHPTKEARIVAV